MKVSTNYQWRDFVYGYELPEKVRADFDYIHPNDLYGSLFVKYRGWFYHVGEFTTMENWAAGPFSDWHGYISETFYSGVLIRISDDGEQYQIANYTC